ncbi:hypothetical protein [Kitasatospora sp. NPDC098663]|uniref:hypothetical protein n=1 Tax=Kitasatospora sp. NPDC098663 TaxID=3364096 RepID=UPI00381E30A8
MTADSDPPVYARATQAPWREILRHRWSGRRDRALVLLDRDGLYHQVGHRRRARADEDPDLEGPVAVRAGLRGFDDAYLVELDERSGTRAVGLSTPYGTKSVDVHVLWWVHDAVNAVRARTVRGWLPVRKDLEQRLRQLKEQFATTGHGLTEAELMHYLATPHLLPHCGLGYRVTDVSAREHDAELRLGEPDGADVPYNWMDKSEDEYAFCRRAVQEGPVSLAALWLARHPDQVREVLDWAVGHAELLRGETTWQDQLALMLGKLSEQERQELSRMLRDRLIALGRRVPGPGPQGAGPEFVKIRSQANGWAGGVANGSPV